MGKATPASLGYRMPAEFEPHRATWIGWPHNPRDWPGKFAAIEWVYVEIVRWLASSEHVHVEIQGRPQEDAARRKLGRAGVDLGRVSFHRIRTNRGWTRDHGPIFVVRPGDLALTDWGFTGWAKYDDYRLDDAVPKEVARVLGVKRFEPRHGGRRIVLEGGSIDVNGQGTLLTTEECLLSGEQVRNPGFFRADYERVFSDYLGVQKTIWLGRGISGDDTHGHVDDLARFVDPRTVVAVATEDRDDPDYAPLAENLDRLRRATDQDGRPLCVVTLPCPAPLVFDGIRLPASYANFYIGTSVVLVPTFDDPNDRRALGVLADLFPARTVVGIHAVDLVWGFGTLHCLTQQEPEPPPRAPT